MHPARFVTVCFLYSGVVSVAIQALLIPSHRTVGWAGTVGWLGTVGAGICIFGTGIYRWRYPDTAETRPPEYGWLTYGMGVLSLLLTALFLGQLLIIY